MFFLCLSGAACFCVSCVSYFFVRVSWCFTVFAAMFVVLLCLFCYVVFVSF